MWADDCSLPAAAVPLERRTRCWPEHDPNEGITSGQTSGRAECQPWCKDSMSVTTGFAEIRQGLRLRYRKCGEGQLVVLLHPFGQSSDYWLQAMPLLAAHNFCTVAPDVPYDGEPFGLEKNLSLPAMTGIVLEVIGRLGASQPFVVVGHQSGASIALQLAAAYPASILRLILFGVPFLGPQERLLAAHLIGEGGALADQAKQCWGSLAVASLDHTALLSGAQQPTLCMSGDNDPLQLATMRAASRLVRGKYIHVGGSGVGVAHQQSAAYVQNVVEFLQKM